MHWNAETLNLSKNLNRGYREVVIENFILSNVFVINDIAIEKKLKIILTGICYSNQEIKFCYRRRENATCYPRYCKERKYKFK